MSDYTTLEDLDQDIGDFDGHSASEGDKVDSTLIKKILFEMKSEFNKSTNDEIEEKEEKEEIEEKEEVKSENIENVDHVDHVDKVENVENIENIENNENNENNENIENTENTQEENQKELPETNETDSSQNTNLNIEEEPKKQKRRRKTFDRSLVNNHHEPLEKRTRRQNRFLEEFDHENTRVRVKRTPKESVVKNAIARKEKSLSIEDKPQRRSSRLSEEIKVNKKIKHKRDGDPDFEQTHEFKVYRYRIKQINKNLVKNSEDNTDISEDIVPNSDSGDGSVQQYQPLSVHSSLCECESLTIMRPNKESIKANDMCQAIDSFDDKYYICCNTISSDTILLRSSKKTPYLQFCESHIRRFFVHNACPPCGTFCTQGIFNVCINKHTFHHECVVSKENFKSCPHCGTSKFAMYKLRTENHKYPLFLPIQKPINRERMARITLQYRENTLLPKTTEDKYLGDNSLLLPCGRIINTEHIPLPEREELEKLFKQINYTDTRYTYRNLYMAAKIGDVEKVIRILASGMNPNRETGCYGSLHAAASGGFLTAVHILVQAGTNLDTLDKSQITPLMAATLNNHNNVIQYLVKAGACLTIQGGDGMTALHFAAKQGNLEACHIMLSTENTPDSLVNIVDDGRWTALVWAAENRHSKVARYLLENRADPHVRDGEMNIALHWSSFSGNFEITEYLLNYGSNMNLSNVHGDTPLHIAARQGADECVTLLLARGARSDMMNKTGLTAKDCVLDQESYCYIAIDLNGKINNYRLKYNSYPKILSNDVSRGRENYPIQCVNAVDDEIMPTNYTYITENCFTSNITIDRTITSLDPCKCDDMCFTSGCMCGKISRKCWYDNNGKLCLDFNFEDPPMLFECNEACSCNILTCKNRIVQRGIQVKLQMIKTKEKSWAIITLGAITKGSYICEYVGEIISDCEADTREDDSYLFDLDNRDGGESYCLDARKYGNISRFINHSCAPNLSPVRVFIGHRDLHFPRIAMFATRDIEPYEELGYDYGEKFWVIKGKTFTCKCNEVFCKYSEDTIQQTLDQYNERVEMEDSLT